jgi:hypothetical protein
MLGIIIIQPSLRLLIVVRTQFIPYLIKLGDIPQFLFSENYADGFKAF